MRLLNIMCYVFVSEVIELYLLKKLFQKIDVLADLTWPR